MLSCPVTSMPCHSVNHERGEFPACECGLSRHSITHALSFRLSFSQTHTSRGEDLSNVALGRCSRGIAFVPPFQYPYPYISIRTSSPSHHHHFSKSNLSFPFFTNLTGTCPSRICKVIIVVLLRINRFASFAAFSHTCLLSCGPISSTSASVAYRSTASSMLYWEKMAARAARTSTWAKRRPRQARKPSEKGMNAPRGG